MTARGQRFFSEPGQRGLTLLELLLVVFILSSIALVTVSIVDSADEQLRYEDTRARIELVKKGIIGDPSVTVNNQPLISGFVADIGRLPKSIPELIYREPFGIDPLPEWQFYPEVGLWAGWRGPYIEPLLEKDQNDNPILTYRDGWDNRYEDVEEDLLLFGWKEFNGWDENDPYDPNNFELKIQSFGSDGDDIPPEQGYSMDYPLDHYITIIEKNDHMLDVCSLEMEVNVRNMSIFDIELRLMIIYPRHGSLDFNDMPPWPASDTERDETNYLSNKLTFKKGSEREDKFTFQTYSTNGKLVEKNIPCGLRSVVVVNNDTGKIIHDDEIDMVFPYMIYLIPRATTTQLPPKQYWTFGISSGQPGQLQEPP